MHVDFLGQGAVCQCHISLMPLNENLNTMFQGSKAESANLGSVSDLGLWRAISDALLILILIVQDQWLTDCQMMEHCRLSSVTRSVVLCEDMALWSRSSAHP